MKRRAFLKSTAAFLGWLAIGGMSLGYAQERGYYHILLISDLHLPVRKKKFPDKETQNEILGKKQNLLKTVNAWTDVDEVALLGDLAARYGNEKEFRVVDDYLGQLQFPYYAVAGNHDYAYKDEPVKSKKGKKHKKAEGPNWQLFKSGIICPVPIMPVMWGGAGCFICHRMAAAVRWTLRMSSLPG